ncbi:MAG: ABC transporter ATP-binding protein [Alphaproteobacteria bacterium]|nr:ABC transporter ATP-binding protein [Alphaproteobacteria bacterium]
MSAPFFRADGVEAGYGGVQVLWGVGAELERGQIGCIVGSNGAGKTTFMRCIAGLNAAWKGTIEVDGRAIASHPPHQILSAGVALVPEGRRLFPGMSVRDNLLMGTFLRRDGSAAINADLDRALGMFPVLRERLSQDAGTLSGGEQQMCAIGRGLMSRPRLLLIDELSLGLAPRIVEQLTHILREINEQGVTILLVEQDVITALELADIGFVMDRGRIVKSGPTEELADDPVIREAYLGIV